MNIEKRSYQPLTPEQFLKDKDLGKFDQSDPVKCMHEYAAYRVVCHHNKLITARNDLKELNDYLTSQGFLIAGKGTDNT
jgi:hypothetical protein